MSKNRDFAVLVGRAFLHEIESGHRDSAIAFGRAFLLALDMRGPEDRVRNGLAGSRNHGEGFATVLN